MEFEGEVSRLSSPRRDGKYVQDPTGHKFLFRIWVELLPFTFADKIIFFILNRFLYAVYLNQDTRVLLTYVYFQVQHLLPESDK